MQRISHLILSCSVERQAPGFCIAFGAKHMHETAQRSARDIEGRNSVGTTWHACSGSVSMREVLWRGSETEILWSQNARSWRHRRQAMVYLRGSRQIPRQLPCLVYAHRRLIGTSAKRIHNCLLSEWMPSIPRDLGSQSTIPFCSR